MNGGLKAYVWKNLISVTASSLSKTKLDAKSCNKCTFGQKFNITTTYLHPLTDHDKLKKREVSTTLTVTPGKVGSK